MPASFPVSSGVFVGRDDYISRYRARLDHFKISLYVGLPGIGKTTLLLQLAPIAQEKGLEKCIYLSIKPGEGIVSLLARVEAQLEARVTQSSERQSDSFRRLIDVLSTHKALVILDDLDRLKREDLTALVRTIKGTEGQYRILASSRTDPDLSAMDRALVHIEALRPLKPESVKALAASFGLGAEAQETLEMDAIRGGSSSHPISLIFMASVLGESLPDSDFLRTLTARSISSFKSIWERCQEVLSEEEQGALISLSAVAAPIEKKIAVKAFGSAIESLHRKHLIDEIDGALYVHWVVRQVLDLSDARLELKAAHLVAGHLRERSVQRCEPTGVIRAGEILAHAGAVDEAVEVLSDGWGDVRDFGFLQAYLKSLASIPADETMSVRLRVLAARARMRQGNPAMLRDEMEALAKTDDAWTQSRSLAALVYIYNKTRDHKGVVKAYTALEAIKPDKETLIQGGTIAAISMVRLGRVSDAEELARRLLKLLKGRAQYEREGGMHRLIARVCAQAGRLEDAVEQATAAAKCFEKAGDLYHAATAFGYIGDLHRETGEFEKAREAFQQFHAYAVRWGDRNLIQIAELTDAWVCIDVGDLTTALKIVAEVEKSVGAGSSRRLKRYLAAAKALLAAGRGRHEEAADMLKPVIDSWASAGQRNIADVLRASRVRSLIACGKLDDAREIVDLALEQLDAKVQGPRVATFLRESALIRLRQKDTKKAMTELSKARKLFAKGGNRREEAITLHRIAHAALDEGNVKLATKRAKECLELANTIQHARAIALARELQSELHLINNEPAEAVEAGKEAMVALRKLGDDLGTLYTSVNLLRAYIINGDLSNAIRLGPRVGAHAERVEVREVRIRAIILTGIALLKKGKLDAAKRCFREIPVGVLHPVTGALMWRLGEALAALEDEDGLVLERRKNWVAELRRLPELRQTMAIALLTQLALPPRQRCHKIAGGESELVGTEVMGWFDPTEYHIFIDIQNNRVIEGQKEFELSDDESLALCSQLVSCSPRVLSFDLAYDEISEPADDDEDDLTDKQKLRVVKNTFKSLQKQLKGSEHFKAATTATGIKLTLPKSSIAFIPIEYRIQDLTRLQRELLGLLGQQGKASLQNIQSEYELTRAEARREVAGLVEAGHVEVIRDGRGQAYRLA